jgi:anthranilate synthase component 1
MLFHATMNVCSLPADILTPVSAYLKVRDIFPHSLLLESSGHGGREGNYSYICCQPLAGIEAGPDGVREKYPDGTATEAVLPKGAVLQELSSFLSSFELPEHAKACCAPKFFGHINYDVVRYFETVSIREHTDGSKAPDLQLNLYRFVIVFDHFHHTVYLTELFFDDTPSGMDGLKAALRTQHMSTYNFDTVGGETALVADEEYLQIVEEGRKHCLLGDVFQVVLSQGFAQSFRGDDFNVYRALRMVNPSPYLFYFDYGNYRLMGSSPETQVKTEGDTTIVHPIAGTCSRTGDIATDLASAEKLSADPKENAEHVMLVDLARNDLSKSHDEVNVTVFKELKLFPHVIHIVSEVSGTGPRHKDPLLRIAETFPAGTLSGAPKYKAMQLIDKYEKYGRGYYGGCIGYLRPDGNVHQAIMIRSFLSRDNTLYYRAGAGIVAASVPDNELREVAHKLKGLREAVQRAKEI